MTYHSHPQDIRDPNEQGYPHERELADFLRKCLDLADTDRISIYSMKDSEYGYRVHEISEFHPDPVRGMPFGSGASWMASDPDAAAVLFRAERYVIGYDEEIVDLGDDEFTDFHQEDEHNLYYAIHGKYPEWQWEDRRVKA